MALPYVVKGVKKLQASVVGGWYRAITGRIPKNCFFNETRNWKMVIPKKMQQQPKNKKLVSLARFCCPPKIFSTRSFCCRNHRPSRVSEPRNVKEGISMIPEKIFWAILSTEAQRQNSESQNGKKGLEVYYRSNPNN